MPPYLTALAIAVGIQLLSLPFGGKATRRATSSVLILVALQVGIPIALWGLAIAFPPPSSGDAWNLGPAAGMYLLFTAYLVWLLAVPGLSLSLRMVTLTIMKRIRPTSCCS